MEIDDLAREYESKSDEELLRLALGRDDLTSEANSALNIELSKRNIDRPETLEGFRQEEWNRKKDLEKNPGKLWVIHQYGVGRKPFGKADYVYNADTGTEQFSTTIFIVLFWLPLIPSGTFRVERKRAWFSNDMTVLERLPLDWEQVLKVWIVAAGSLFIFIWICRFLPWLFLKFWNT